MHSDRPVVPDPGDVEVTVRPASDGVAVVVVAGDVDVAGVRAIRGGIEEAATTARAVVLDLAAVALLASAGMTLLLELTEELRARGIALRLVSTARAVRRPLQITGLDRVLTLHEDVAGAIAAGRDDSDHG